MSVISLRRRKGRRRRRHSSTSTELLVPKNSTIRCLSTSISSSQGKQHCPSSQRVRELLQSAREPRVFGVDVFPFRFLWPPPPPVYVFFNLDLLNNQLQKARPLRSRSYFNFTRGPGLSHWRARSSLPFFIKKGPLQCVSLPSLEGFSSGPRKRACRFVFFYWPRFSHGGNETKKRGQRGGGGPRVLSLSLSLLYFPRHCPLKSGPTRFFLSLTKWKKK